MRVWHIAIYLGIDAYLGISGLIAIIAVLGAIGCASSNGDVNLIAYVNLEGQINTVSPDGSSTTRISPNTGFFTWPMWSPDARQIVFSGISLENNGRGFLALYLYRLGDDQPNIIYTNEPGMGPILRDMPHYPLWAPDSSRLTFMASAPQGLTLFLINPQADTAAVDVLRNAPLYAMWSADSLHMVVHGGVDHFLVDVEGEITLKDLGIRTASYRVPAWWPSGDRIVLISEGETDSRGLYILDVDSGRQRLLEQVPGEAAFLWSPNGKSLAVAQSELPGGLIYRGVKLVSLDGDRLPFEIQKDVLAFFWSPDSTKLAYVTLADSSGVLRWMVLNVVDGREWVLADFIPSGQQLTIVEFFDQFSYSHSPWSPDSDSLVFAGILSSEATSASSGRQPTSQIIVSNAGPIPSNEPIAEGFLAVWSPR